MEQNSTHIVLEPNRKYFLKPGFGLAIALVIIIGYLYSGELTMSEVFSDPTNGKSLLFIGTVLIILIYAISLVVLYNYVELKDDALIKHYRLPKRTKHYDLKVMEHWIPVTISNGKVIVDRNSCSQLELEFAGGESLKLTADRYKNLDDLLVYLKDKYPGKFIDILEDDPMEG